MRPCYAERLLKEGARGEEMEQESHIQGVKAEDAWQPGLSANGSPLQEMPTTNPRHPFELQGSKLILQCRHTWGRGMLCARQKQAEFIPDVLECVRLTVMPVHVLALTRL
jgi:hypothetical protein